MGRLLAALAIGAACAPGFPEALAGEPHPVTSAGLASKKGSEAVAPAPLPLLAGIVQTHTDERLPLDAASPDVARWGRLLADRATGSTHAIDPRLPGLVRALVARWDGDAGAPRVEVVSGFRSPKLNEMLRKKGHHVASHSQHSLGNALDFRVLVPCAALPADAPAHATCSGLAALDPRDVGAAIRALGWTGGVGTYTGDDDWFTHADVGPDRSWREGPDAPAGARPRAD